MLYIQLHVMVAVAFYIFTCLTYSPTIGFELIIIPLICFLESCLPNWKLDLKKYLAGNLDLE